MKIILFTFLLFQFSIINSLAQSTGTYNLFNFDGLPVQIQPGASQYEIPHTLETSFDGNSPVNLVFTYTGNESFHITLPKSSILEIPTYVAFLDGSSVQDRRRVGLQRLSSTDIKTEWVVEHIGNGLYSIKSKLENGQYLYPVYPSVTGPVGTRESPYGWKFKTIKGGFKPFSLLRVRTTNLNLNPVHNDDCKRLQGSVTFKLTNQRLESPYEKTAIQSGYSVIRDYAGTSSVLFTGTNSTDYQKRDFSNEYYHNNEIDYLVGTEDLINGNIILNAAASVAGCHKSGPVSEYNCNVRYDKVRFVVSSGSDSIEVEPNMSEFFYAISDDGHILSGVIEVEVLNNPY